MSTFNEADHPRQTDGKFTDKPQSVPEVSLVNLSDVAVEAARYELHGEGEGAERLRALAEQQPAEVIAALRRDCGVSDVQLDPGNDDVDTALAAARAAVWRAEAIEAGFSGETLDIIRDDHISALLAAEVDYDRDGGPAELSEDYVVDDIAGESRFRLEAEVYEFVTRNRDDVMAALNEGVPVGQDIALTRNRHGGGFWDRGLGALGERLTGAAHELGEQHLVAGDDNRVYANW